MKSATALRAVERNLTSDVQIGVYLILQTAARPITWRRFGYTSLLFLTLKYGADQPTGTDNW